MAAVVRKDLVALRKTLRSRGTVDIAKCVKLVNSLKIALTSLQDESGDVSATESASNVVLARDVYEQAALLSIKQADTEGFERHLALAKTLYVDYAGLLQPSPDQNRILALNLMRLLAQNRIAEFHTELELVSPQTRTDPNIQYVLGLEQYLMEGSYARITSESEPPDASFNFFLNMLMCTVRDEIAASSESAYKKLSLPVAMKLLSFSDEDELRAFGASRGWKIQRDVVLFSDIKEHPLSMEQVPSMDLIKRALEYAQNLEQIV